MLFRYYLDIIFTYMLAAAAAAARIILWAYVDFIIRPRCIYITYVL